MDKPIDNFWNLNLRELKQKLQKNGFDVYLADSAEGAKDVVLNEILPELKPKTVSWGGSKTLADTGLQEYLRDSDEYESLDTWDKGLSKEDKYELRRKAMLVEDRKSVV